MGEGVMVIYGDGEEPAIRSLFAGDEEPQDASARVAAGSIAAKQPETPPGEALSDVYATEGFSRVRKWAERAVNAGLQIVDKFRGVADEMISRWRLEFPAIGPSFRLEVGVAIHTGTPMIGVYDPTGSIMDVGAGRAPKTKHNVPGHLTYTAIGEDVNLVSRVCQKVAGNEVWVTSTAAQILSRSAMFQVGSQPMPTDPLKGFAHPMEVFKIEGMNYRSGQHPGVDG
jgi:class 3 adenylate cyclase